jgi:probable HAF family extracellular repeat protein
MRKSCPVPRLLAVTLVACAAMPVGAQVYTATALPGLGGPETVVTGINAAGVVVGYSCDATYVTHAVSWTGGVVRDLGTLGGTVSHAQAVNGTGAIVGFSDSGAEAAISALAWNNTASAGLPTLGGSSAYAFGSNDAGLIVGVATLTLTEGAQQYAHAALWNGGAVTDLGTLGGVSGTPHGSSATAVNGAVIVVGFSDAPTGQHATRWSGTAAVDLGTLGGDSSAALAINGPGLIVGYSDVSGDGALHAVSWNGLSLTDLGTLGGPMSLAAGINTGGQIVGTSLTSTSSQRAVLWNNLRILDLNGLTKGLPAGVVLTVAVGINDAAQIAAYGIDTRTGVSLAFLLTPGA